MPTPVSPAVRRRLAGLRRRVEMRALAHAAKARGVSVWIVGGAVRDALMGRPVPEIDVAVRGDAQSLAAALDRQGSGRAVFLSEDRPGPRVFRVAGRRPIDIAEVEGGAIETDLARRDFTVNAIAVDLADGSLVDPFGGVSDVARRRLSCVRAANFREDPLRALRAARFLASHGLAPDRGTLSAARAAAPRVADVAVERISTELARLLESPRAAPALAWAARARLLASTFGVNLTPRRAAALARSLSALDDPATRRLSPERRRRLRMAMLAMRLDLDAREARRWLSQRRWTRREADEIGLLVDLAGRAARLRGRRGRWRWLLDAGTLAADAVYLAARAVPGARKSAAQLSRLARAPLRRLRISGADVMHWCAISPGPAVGVLLDELRLAAAAGEVKSRREARNWLIGQVQQTLSPAIISPH
jgi:tRNA nucleotidyltransferase (CCA-adding enzyme)